MTNIQRCFLLCFVLSSLACTLGGLLPTEMPQLPAEVPSTLTEVAPSPPAEEQVLSSPQPVTEESPAVPTVPQTPPLPSSQCQNEYYPVILGATWQYQMSGVSSDTFVRSIVAVREDGFDDQDVFGSGTVRQGSWACREGDLIGLTLGAGAAVSAGEMQTNFTIESNEGVSLPANPQLGQEWSQTIVYLGQTDVGGSNLDSRNMFERVCKAGGLETVQVPAGEFQALRVECSTKINISVSGMPMFSFSESGSTWYASGVGMVKSSSATDLGSTEIVLLAYNLP